jgi:4'-phosphopantetheinyl transferase
LSELRELTRGQVHLWHVLTEAAKQRGWLSRYHHLLTSADRERHQRFVFEKDRDQFLIARAFLRTTLSRYADIKPEDWLFQLNDFGKPSIDARQSDEKLRFNLSHCAGLLICGVTVGCEIGVDCENSDRNVEIEQLAPRVFSPSEKEYFHSVSASKRKETFFRLWTLKEAYIKACGIGMSLPLQNFSIDLAGAPPIGIRFDHEIQDRPHEWQFLEPTFSKPFLAAVAVNLPQEEPLSIELHSA